MATVPGTKMVNKALLITSFTVFVCARLPELFLRTPIALNDTHCGRQPAALRATASGLRRGELGRTVALRSPRRAAFSSAPSRCETERRFAATRHHLAALPS